MPLFQTWAFVCGKRVHICKNNILTLHNSGKTIAPQWNMTAKTNLMWKYYALLSASFAALTAIFAKIGVKDINSDLTTAIRTSVILIITWGIALAGSHSGEIRNISGHTWLFLVLSGVATGFSWLFYFKALQTGSVSRVAPIDKLSVVITICLSFLLLKEQISARVIVGAVLITLGSIVMLVK